MEQNQNTTKAPTLQGVVVSAKMDKTIVVAVDTLKRHAKYQKQYRSTKKYKVHTEENKYQEGDKVVFRECRPLSKGKRHRVVESQDADE